jgi:beta-glucosidase
LTSTGYVYSLWEFQVYGTTYIPTCGQKDVALNRPAEASSTQNASTPASAAVDGNSSTRWSRAFSDPQWWLKIG